MMDRIGRVQNIGCVVVAVVTALSWLGSRPRPTPRADKRGRVSPAAAVSQPHAKVASAGPTRRRAGNFARLPLRFETNLGQTDRQVKFFARGSGYSLLLTSSEAVLALSKPSQESEVKSQKAEIRSRQWPVRSHGKALIAEGFSLDRTKAHGTHGVPWLPADHSSLVTGLLRMKLVGANPAPRIAGRDALPGRVNYYLGNDPRKWRTNVRTYAKVEYQGVYPGVDLVYYGNQGQLEYDFVVRPGADPARIRLRFADADKVEVDPQGDLALDTDAGPVRLHKPVVYQEVDGARREIAGRYVLKGAREVGFDLAGYDPREPLVIDPVLSYSTYLGGRGVDETFRIALDPIGNIYVVGLVTTSTDFPTENPFQPQHGGGENFYDTFVTKFDPTGSALVYSTYLGGSGDDLGHDIAVDAEGNAYITGWTRSRDFPTVNAFQPALRGPVGAFVTKFDPTGAVVYSTYLGGSDGDAGTGIAVDAEGNAYVTGNTFSRDFPVANPFQPALRGRANAFITKFDATGSALLYSTYFGGSGGDFGQAIALDGEANIYITGETDSLDFPTASAFQPTYGGGGEDAFVTKFDSSGETLIYSTYLGGTREDVAYGLAVDAKGSAYVTGGTFSLDFPVVEAFQPNFAGGATDAFVTKFDPSGSVVYSTYLGGSNGEYGRDIAVDTSGNVYVTGETLSRDFPLQDPFQDVLHASTNAFVTEFDASGASLIYSTYLGGSCHDQAFGIAVDAQGNAWVTGGTCSTDFPVRDPFQEFNAGGYDAFVTKISPGESPSPLLKR